MGSACQSKNKNQNVNILLLFMFINLVIISNFFISVTNTYGSQLVHEGGDVFSTTNIDDFTDEVKTVMIVIHNTKDSSSPMPEYSISLFCDVKKKQLLKVYTLSSFNTVYQLIQIWYAQVVLKAMEPDNELNIDPAKQVKLITEDINSENIILDVKYRFDKNEPKNERWKGFNNNINFQPYLATNATSNFFELLLRSKKLIIEIKWRELLMKKQKYDLSGIKKANKKFVKACF